jgi:hypothetical protein
VPQFQHKPIVYTAFEAVLIDGIYYFAGSDGKKAELPKAEFEAIYEPVFVKAPATGSPYITVTSGVPATGAGGVGKHAQLVPEDSEGQLGSTFNLLFFSQ